jgi:hypothetical protein
MGACAGEAAMTTSAKALPLRREDGTWRVRETEHYFIDILRMGYNLRIVTVPKSETWSYERGWCYQEEFAMVVARCYQFDPEKGEEPVGWVKEPGTGRRGCAWYFRSKIRAHRGYESDCPDCGREDLE